MEEVISKYDNDSSIEEWSSSEGDTYMIFLYAFSLLQGAQTIHVVGYNEKRPL